MQPSTKHIRIRDNWHVPFIFLEIVVLHFYVINNISAQWVYYLIFVVTSEILNNTQFHLIPDSLTVKRMLLRNDSMNTKNYIAVDEKLIGLGSSYYCIYKWNCAVECRCIYYVLIHLNTTTHFFWNMTNESASKSDKSMVFPFAITSGCFLLMSHPMCEKKNPLLALCGSASVSLYLWCCLWSLTQMYMQF